ncbi:MAG: alpha/beta hydrolase [Caulobacter sp.]
MLWALVGLAAVSSPAGETRPAAFADQFAQASSVRLAWRSYGAEEAPPVVLLGGIGMQLVEWPPALIDGLVAQGRRVIVDDARDTGASSHAPSQPPFDIGAAFAAIAAGSKPRLPYSADDMVADLGALMDAAKAPRADLIGVSGGATVAALLAAKHPERVRSLTLVMANSGNRALPIPFKPERMALAAPSASVEETRFNTWRALAGKDEAFDERSARERAKLTAQRDPDIVAPIRQGVALMALGDVRATFSKIKAPTVVLHGADDPLISPQAGREVAEAIGSAQYRLVDEMGHDVNPAATMAILAAVRPLR